MNIEQVAEVFSALLDGYDIEPTENLGNKRALLVTPLLRPKVSNVPGGNQQLTLLFFWDSTFVVSVSVLFVHILICLSCGGAFLKISSLAGQVTFSGLQMCVLLCGGKWLCYTAFFLCCYAVTFFEKSSFTPFLPVIITTTKINP